MFTERKRFRKNFGKIREVAELPNLIELQKSSYGSFLHPDEHKDLRSDIGLQEAFRSIFPITDAAGRAQVDFCEYHFDDPKYTENECRHRGLTYASSLRAVFRLIVWEINKDTGERSVRDIK
jgi:DNA-directed RNA polymerase subunit beta